MLPGALVRMKSGAHVYRSKFLRFDGNDLVFSAPLSRDSYVPLHPGDVLTLETTTPSGLLVLQSKVSSRELDPHELLITEPHEVAFFNRRMAHRVAYGQNVTVEVDQTECLLMDVSERGIKFRCWREHAKGERVNIRLPWDSEAVGAWIIDCKQLTGEFAGKTEYRAIFEDLVEPPDELPNQHAS